MVGQHLLVTLLLVVFASVATLTSAPGTASSAAEHAFLRDHCYSRGRWERFRPEPGRIWGGIAGNYSYRCLRTAEYNRSLEWRWVVSDPARCPLEPWNTSRICELLRGRSIIIYGDSLTFDIAASLFANLNGSTEGRLVSFPEQCLFHHRKRHHWFELISGCQLDLCGGPGQKLQLFRGHHLIQKPFRILKHHVLGLPASPAPIVVISTGTHYVGGKDKNVSAATVS
eukprot:RCo014027